MVGGYSPHADAGGTLHLPSPTQIHNVDPASAFKQLRRSLSRSPSKIPSFRLVTSKSASPSLPSSPLSPSLGITPNKAVPASGFQPLHSNSPSPLATPHPPNMRKTRTPARKMSPSCSSPRRGGISRSPRKRSLNESPNVGNAPPRSSAGSSDDQENMSEGCGSPVSRPLAGGLLKASAPPLHVNNTLPIPRATTRFEKGYGSWGAKSSPLKRSDGIMNLDQGAGDSPSAKRRSLHGGVFGPDFDIFDHEASFDGSQDTLMTDTEPSHENASLVEHLSPMPKRMSSLRRSTLQQRHDKPLFARTKPNSDISFDFATPNSTGQSGQLAPSKSRFRMSLDSVVPPLPRDSPFSSQGGLPNASAHPISQISDRHSVPSVPVQPVQNQRHPLSRTISQSTSNSSMADDSPTHFPIRQPEQRRPFVDFSKSLPMGATRPGSREGQSSSQATSGTSFATPENYKLVKPLPAAFMSTGLISKRHKHLDESQPNLGLSTSTMPDTPCKRHSLAEMPSPTARPQEVFVKSHQARHSFGTPSTPYNPHAGPASPGTLGKGVNIFGASLGYRVLRQESDFGEKGGEHHQSPPEQGDSQSSAEFEVPPTPTKQVLSASSRHPTPIGGNVKRQSSTIPSFKESSSSNRSHQSMEKCKLPSPETISGLVDEHSEGLMDDSPLTALRFRNFSRIPISFSTSRLLRNSKSPTPLTNTSFSAPSFVSKRSQAKRSPLSPASPLQEPVKHLSPRTPRETMLPPDPSGLSISTHADAPFRSLDDITSSTFRNTVYPPATPTAPKGSTASFGKSLTNMTPSNQHTPVTVEIDPVLTSKFDKVELIGVGEFSQVYRVSSKAKLRSPRNYFSLPSGACNSPKTPLPDRVWAVKKTRHPYIGPKDRQRKLEEVRTLDALGRSDHTVELFDSWEDKNHLYIQTEFCEEGSLDGFLDQVGRKARLDDFRIWKIMLEMALGLQHIHDRGFIHLDLKPANVLITFEGVLKIADFGMATPWPAPPGIDGEGDREYIGPEILRGEFDKPADVFALGLIVLEIAGNVMLPENGASWQRLRTGDMSDVPSLTWSSDTSNILRDASGKPFSHTESMEDFYESDPGDQESGSPRLFRCQRPMKGSLFQTFRSGELADPPSFMVDHTDPDALDNVVRQMISPESADRPIIDQVLATYGVQWAEARRRAGATIFEGNWGPADEVLADDAEMIDV